MSYKGKSFIFTINPAVIAGVQCTSCALCETGLGNMVSIRDVARLAHVSHQTVSNAINSPEVVSREKLKRIQDAIRELGYRPNASARRLRSGQTDTIALGIAIGGNRAPSPIFDAFLHLLAEHANELNKRIVLYPRKDEQSELAHIAELREQSDIDAIIINELEKKDGRPQWLLDTNQPFVLFGRPWGLPEETAQRIPWVDVNGYSGIRQITEKLIRQGCRRISFLGWDSGTGTAQDRESGWRDAMLANHLYDDELDSWSIGTQESVDAGSQVALELFSRHEAIDAVVCASDTLAVGTVVTMGRLFEQSYMASLERTSPQIPLPQRTVVTGFDNSSLAQAFSIPSAEQPLDQVAGILIRMIADMSKGEEVTADKKWHHLLEPKIIWRNRIG